jgi:hypothetical protein
MVISRDSRVNLVGLEAVQTGGSGGNNYDCTRTRLVKYCTDPSSLQATLTDALTVTESDSLITHQ